MQPLAHLGPLAALRLAPRQLLRNRWGRGEETARLTRCTFNSRTPPFLLQIGHGVWGDPGHAVQAGPGGKGTALSPGAGAVAHVREGPEGPGGTPGGAALWAESLAPWGALVRFKRRRGPAPWGKGASAYHSW